MTPLIVEEARRRFGPDIVIKPLSDLRLEAAEEVEEEEDMFASESESWHNILLIGVLLKLEEKDEKFLAEMMEELELRVPPPCHLYIHQQETLMLEDDQTRVKLNGLSLDASELVSGVVLGVWGRYEVDEDEFWVDDLVYARVASPHMQVEAGGSQQELSLCVMSGLELGTEDAHWLMSAQLAADWLVGNVSSPGEQKELAKIERLIIAGESLSSSHSDCEDWHVKHYRTIHTMVMATAAARQLDDLLVNILASLNVDLMPGTHDPVQSRMPQQPIPQVSTLNLKSDIQCNIVTFS